MLSLLAVIKKKSQEDDDEDEEEDEEDDDEDQDDEEEEEDASDSDDSESEAEVEDELTDSVKVLHLLLPIIINTSLTPLPSQVSGELVQKVTDALGDHGAGSGDDDDDDIQMDDIPDDDMARLDSKLVEAFRALGGRKDRLAKKKAAMASLAEQHFKLRVLELVETYLGRRRIGRSRGSP